MSSFDHDLPFDFPPRGQEARRQRSLRDPEGNVWTVREVEYADVPPSLLFEGEGVIRRVRKYPSHWYKLSEAELYALSWKV